MGGVGRGKGGRRGRNWGESARLCGGFLERVPQQRPHLLSRLRHLQRPPALRSKTPPHPHATRTRTRVSTRHETDRRAACSSPPARALASGLAPASSSTLTHSAWRLEAATRSGVHPSCGAAGAGAWSGCGRPGVSWVSPGCFPGSDRRVLAPSAGARRVLDAAKDGDPPPPGHPRTPTDTPRTRTLSSWSTSAPALQSSDTHAAEPREAASDSAVHLPCGRVLILSIENQALSIEHQALI